MKYNNMGRTGLKVSQICLGAMNLGDTVGEEESIKIIKGAIDVGVNFIDTADMYAGGKSEEAIGKALKGNRDSMVIATKVCGKSGPGPNDKGLSRKHIMQSVEGSLRRLQTDYIDLYYAHTPDYDTPIEETLRIFDDLIRDGKVRYIGCSNFAAWQLSKALWMSDLNKLARFECVEPPYNLLTRDIEMELLPLCQNEGVSLCTYNPLAGEMLTGLHEFGKPPVEGRFTHKLMGPGYLERYWSEMNFKAVDRFKQVAKEHGCTLAQFAIAWIFSNDAITSVLSGITTMTQLSENIEAINITLSEEELKICDEIWKMFRPPGYHYAKTREEVEKVPDLLKK